MARTFLHDYMPAVRNQSDKSSEAYKQSLNTYLTFLKSEKGIADEKVTFDAFCRANVKEFVEWLSGKKYTPKTINLKLTAIRSFLKFCGDEDFELRGIHHDVCTVKKVKEEKKPIEYLQPSATKAILAVLIQETVLQIRQLCFPVKHSAACIPVILRMPVFLFPCSRLFITPYRGSGRLKSGSHFIRQIPVIRQDGLEAGNPGFIYIHCKRSKELLISRSYSPAFLCLTHLNKR